MSFPVRAPNNEIIILGKKLRKTQYLTKKNLYIQTDSLRDKQDKALCRGHLALLIG